MKVLIFLGMGLFAAAGYFGYRTLTSGIQQRIGSLQDADVFFVNLRRGLEDAGRCPTLFAKPLVINLDANKSTIHLNQDLIEPREVQVEGVSLGPLVELGDRAFQGRLRVKLASQIKEVNVAILRFDLDEKNAIRSCVAAVVAEEGGYCGADNSPDPLRAGGRANIVRAPHGTTAVSGPAASPVFAYKGILKWLTKGECGPVSVCEHGLWSTVDVRPCAD